MSQNITCVVCGGKDFHNEAGFYFCNECQTQSQEIREYFYEAADNLTDIKLKAKKVQSKSDAENHKKITSWEGYNYILAGLVSELIELGAKEDLKDIILSLWHSYLSKLNLWPQTDNDYVELGAVFHKKDALIMFNMKARKKKRKLKDQSLKTDNPELQRRERVKQRRELIRTDYETNALRSGLTTSIFSKSLGSISSHGEAITEKQIKFSKEAKQEMRKKMSLSHFKAHMNNVEDVLKCHKGRTRDVTKKYLNSGKHLTPTKLYALLYIGLILLESEIQLSDLLRFCREGHLSFLSYKHFFPEMFTDKQIDETVYRGGLKVLPSHKTMREATINMCKYLNIKIKNVFPDFNALVQKYCIELNLPDQIKELTLSLMALTKPKMDLNDGMVEMPNFEGRAMAFIIYIMKFFYGLDGVTEFKFSKFAEDVNKITCTEENSIHLQNKMFVWSDWMNFINYREIVLKNNYFPIKYLLEPDNVHNMDLFISFLKQKHRSYECGDKNLSMAMFRKLLGDLKIYQANSHNDILTFESTLTPFHSYFEKIKQFRVLHSEVHKDFSLKSVDFLINYDVYLKLLNDSDYVVKINSANSNCHFLSMDSSNEDNAFIEKQWKKQFKKLKIEDMSVDVLSNKAFKQRWFLPKIHPNIQPSKPAEFKASSRKNLVGRNNKGQFCRLTAPDKKDHDDFTPKYRGKWFVSSWKENKLLEQHKYNPSMLHVKYGNKELKNILKNWMKRSKEYEEVLLNNMDNDKYNIHYQSKLDAWINVIDTATINNLEWKNFMSTLPSTFQWLLEKSALIIEQKPIDLFTEFMFVELYVNYVYLNNVPLKIDEYDGNHKSIEKLITKAKERW